MSVGFFDNEDPGRDSQVASAFAPLPLGDQGCQNLSCGSPDFCGQILCRRDVFGKGRFLLQEDIYLLASPGMALTFGGQRNSVAATILFLGLFDGCEKALSSDAVPEMCLRDKLQGVLHVMQVLKLPRPRSKLGGVLAE